MTITTLQERFTQPDDWRWGQMTPVRAGTIRYGQLCGHAKPRAHIVYIMGLSEFSEKTFELARDFNAMACNFSVLDRYGQGKSTRYLPDPYKQHSDGIEKDVEDIISFCENHIPPQEPIILLCHSAGGLIGLHTLAARPDMFSGAIFSAPLWGFETPPVKDHENFWAKLPIPASVKKQYIPGGGTFTPRRHGSMKPADFSSDPVRNRLDDIWRENTAALQTGASTIGWVKHMCRAIIQARQPGFAESIKTPVLIFSAGQDRLVDNQDIKDMVRRFPDAGFHEFSDGKHDLLIEKDSIRNALLEKTNRFLTHCL